MKNEAGDDKREFEPIHISINGIDPAPQGSKRHVGGGRLIEASKRCKPWRMAIVGACPTISRPMDVPVAVSIVFRFSRPKSHLTTNGQPRANAPKQYTVKRNDIDKVCRSSLDALVDGGVLADDSFVVVLNASKRYCLPYEPAGAIISVIPQY